MILLFIVISGLFSQTFCCCCKYNMWNLFFSYKSKVLESINEHTVVSQHLYFLLPCMYVHCECAMAPHFRLISGRQHYSRPLYCRKQIIIKKYCTIQGNLLKSNKNINVLYFVLLYLITLYLLKRYFYCILVSIVQ